MDENLIRTEPFAAALLRAMPLAVAVLGPDLAVVALNGAAEKMFGAPEVEVVGRRAGDAFHCVNAAASPEGCGHSVDCGECLLRRAGLAAIAGQTVEQQEFAVRIRRGGAAEEKYVLLSASPFR
ncbi:MAG: PAS domain-containing protein, partial [Deferrisomatales bacterium]